MVLRRDSQKRYFSSRVSKLSITFQGAQDKSSLSFSTSSVLVLLNVTTFLSCWDTLSFIIPYTRWWSLSIYITRDYIVRKTKNFAFTCYSPRWITTTLFTRFQLMFFLNSFFSRLKRVVQTLLNWISFELRCAWSSFLSVVFLFCSTLYNEGIDNTIFSSQ